MDNLQSEEKKNERCPCCDKEIKWFKDYPLMQVLSSSVIKPEEVPKIIPYGGCEEIVVKQPEKLFGGIKRAVVPAEVVSYLDEHPEEEIYGHQDGYIYERYLFQKRAGNPETEIFWYRTKNISDSIKGLVRDKSNKVLEPLEKIVGKIIPSKQFIDEFETEQGEPKEIAPGFYILPNEGLKEGSTRTINLALCSNPEEMGRLTRETLYTQVLENFAMVKYIGKMLNEK